MRKAPEIPHNVFLEDRPAPAPRKDKSRAAKGAEPSKVQITIYLTEETATDLERARFELLAKHNVKVPKSSIVEYAIIKAVADIEALARDISPD